MIVAIDYDGTFGENPLLWSAVARVLKLKAEVICVTGRPEHEPVPPIELMVYYCGGKAKRRWCESNGIRVDVWIDDEPKWIDTDSGMGGW